MSLYVCRRNDTGSHSLITFKVITLINFVISEHHVHMRRLGSDTCFPMVSVHECEATCIYLTGLIWLLQHVPRLMIMRISTRPVSMSFGCDYPQSRMCYQLNYQALHVLSIRVCLVLEWGL